ncbi:hypothetical protein GCM10009808_20800 [Microbacterium sediminicola]|uniref:Amino acid transporter n=1 Tax=Microbacterium sediminicola TaxID=415210 RepID=A0ABP4UC36_9MICO
MSDPVPTGETPWMLLGAASTADLLSGTDVRWWLSGGSAYDQWRGEPLRERDRTTISVVYSALPTLIDALPEGMTAWARFGDEFTPWADLPDGADIPAAWIFDADRDAWVLQVNLEDGTAARWVYRRDPRLQLPWDKAVLDIDGIPTGAPEVQLVWKALRPYPDDEADKDIVLPALPEEARQWWEKAILSIHPHSTWSIHVRSPFAPAKASWNRTRRNQGL